MRLTGRALCDPWVRLPEVARIEGGAQATAPGWARALAQHDITMVLSEAVMGQRAVPHNSHNRT